MNREMHTLSMGRSYIFTKSNICQIMQLSMKGVYAIGSLNNEGRFTPRFVGRSDECLMSDLYIHELHGKKDCTRFKFAYTESKIESYLKECVNYHVFSPRYNQKHPNKPLFSNYSCPICGD